MKKVTLILTAILFLGVSNLVNAQSDSDVATHNVSFDVPNFAILDIETSGADNDITLSLDESGLEAGSEFDFSSATNSELWLNYTALTDKTGANWNNRKVTVALNAVIPGIDIDLTVAADAGNGEGAVGTSSAVSTALTLTASAQTIITGIGSCYTGDGESNGHNLGYSLKANDYSLLEAGDSKSVVVTYTITGE